jgi:ABC transport system ATP-binding/permease protein
MNVLSVENLSVSFGDRTLFTNITFGIAKGQKVALVAKNGSGKTTLLRCLSGQSKANSGIITYRNDIRVSYLSQDDNLPPEQSIWEAVFAGNSSEMQAISNYEKCLTDNASPEELQKAFEAVDHLNAWDMEYRVREVLDKLQINHPASLIKTLSGGQRKRVQLARVLIENPDFLILDEPTNHLDLTMIEWLENYLEQSNCTLLMVTHDRYFLDRVCDEVLELANESIYKYKGNFTYYLEQKAMREELASVNMEKAQSLLKKELDWIRRQPKARGTKSKARTEAYFDLKEKTDTGPQDDELQLEVNFNRLGTKVIEFHNVSKGYGDKELISKFSYMIKRDEKLGLVGPNGAGKTTLLRMIVGEEQPDGGKIVVGETVEIGYYRQNKFEFSDDLKVIEAITEIAEVIPLKGGRKLTASQLLERFQFNKKMHFQQIGKLSGGEKKRLALCRVLMRNPNVLILDEPTNDLDIYTMSALEDYLMQFTGCVIIISHDRYFIDKVAQHLMVFKGNGVLKEFPGNYSQYLASETKAPEVKTVKSQPAPKVAEKSKSKLSFKDKREFDLLEKEIPELEKKRQQLEEKLQHIADHEDLMKASVDIAALIKSIDSKTERWLELSEMQ